MIKLLAIDMDGTLLNNKKEVTEAQRNALIMAMDRGVEVVLCTGRPLFGTLPLYENLNLGKNNKYIIVNNGCSIYKTDGFELIDYFDLTKEEIEMLYALKKGYNVDFTLTTESHFYYVANENEEPNEYSVLDSKLVFNPLTKISIEEALKSEEIIFKSMFTGEPEDVDKFEKSLTSDIKKKINFVRSQKYILEGIPKKSNKSAGIKKLIKKMNQKIKKDEVMAIGDADNDIEMLKFAGVGVAMGNADNKIKKIANYVTDTNENDGVSKAIENFILKDVNEKE